MRTHARLIVVLLLTATLLLGCVSAAFADGKKAPAPKEAAPAPGPVTALLTAVATALTTITTALGL